MTTIIAQCFRCKHFLEGYKCPAFPEGIPNDILSNEFIHNKKHPEQQGALLFDDDGGKFFREQK
jgi:hypothetical protein